ncbi:Rho termination factor N-terminal domain-containing protein [Micromonospora halophytica]|uniref:Rho termination factor, N-terminal domain n=1 Tax=Micromonospora halophytica TaxID=47864 RepID=A0A1C5HC36_9ACTN|nr:Rho termination factor N-terminal domain-containing protein [Micromonospora halophytica]SCG43564.1 Rho termination factor, N-terminal domain [Micromonospora halophytica]
MTDPSVTATLLIRLAELVRALPAAEVVALAEGRARLAVVPVAQPSTAERAAPPTATAVTGRRGTPHRPVAPVTDPDRAVAALAALTTRHDGTAYLAGWSAKELRALAARLGLRGVAGARKADLVERIVDRTVGFRLNSTAIRQL